jgi:hydrogenase expression/formation protein HypC
MAIPSRITALDGATATVECFGMSRRVSLILLGEEVTLGDYVLVRAGGLAYERIEPVRAREALALFADRMDIPGERADRGGFPLEPAPAASR